jgi:hypothetical protein
MDDKVEGKFPMNSWLTSENTYLLGTWVNKGKKEGRG